MCERFRPLKRDIGRIVTFLGLFPAFEELLLGHLPHHIAVNRMLFVLAHDKKITVRDDMDHLMVGEMERVHERCYLPQKSVVPYGLGFAVRFATLLAKADSLIKFPADTSE